MANYRAADTAYDEGLRKAARNKALAAQPEFELLLSMQQESLAGQRRLWDAIQVAEERLAWHRSHEPDKAVEIGGTLTDIGSMQSGLDRREASAAVFNEALLALEPAYKARKPDRRTATEAMKLWSDAAYEVRDFAKWDTCKLRRELVATIEKELGASNPDLALPLTDLASYCEDEMRASEARALFDCALSIAQATWGTVHPVTLGVLEQQGTYYASREDSDAMVEKGRRILARRIALSKEAYADAPAILAWMRLDELTTDFTADCDRFANSECKRLVSDHLATLSRTWGDDHPAMSLVRSHVSARLGHSSSSAATEADKTARDAFFNELCDTAFKTALSGMGPDHPQTGLVAKECAEHAVHLWRHDRAERFLVHAVRIYSKRFGENDSATQEVVSQLDRSRSILKNKKQR